MPRSYRSLLAILLLCFWAGAVILNYVFVLRCLGVPTVADSDWAYSLAFVILEAQQGFQFVETCVHTPLYYSALRRKPWYIVKFLGFASLSIIVLLIVTQIGLVYYSTSVKLSPMEYVFGFPPGAWQLYALAFILPAVSASIALPLRMLKRPESEPPAHPAPQYRTTR